MTLKGLMKKTTAWLLALTMLLVSCPFLTVPAAADDDYARVADPSTMDTWKTLFGQDVLSTEYAGSVWTDKSVLTDASAFEGTGIALSDDGDNFLVALSAIASNTSIKGLTNVPTDVMLVLDLSSSMYRGKERDPSVVQTMLQSVNHVMEELFALNEYNRVGVTVYYGGGDYLPSSLDCAKVLLPLSRYTYSGNDTAYSFLRPTVSDGKLVSVDVNADVVNIDGETVTGSHTVSDVAGTYTQLGILKALDEMLAADPKVPESALHSAGHNRLPIMVLMSDGEPTAATASFTAQETAGMGNNTVSMRNPAQTDFVTQLTAAYAKACMDTHYAGNALFYTLSLGTSVSLDVMDPSAADALSQDILQNPEAYTEQQMEDATVNRTIDAYWNLLVNDGAVGITVENCRGQWDSTKETVAYTVSPTTATVDGQVFRFPTAVEQKAYVDEAFTASDDSVLSAAFEAILKKIELQSHYFPTLVEGDEEISGYVSFTDRIGEHMSITDIKGILIDNTLFSGAMLARNFVPGGGALGTFDKASPLGDELVRSVRARLGVDGDTARNLIALAYREGQLRYTSDTDFSNYIGWYANAAGEFLGFWYDGITTMPDPADPSLTDETRPAYVIRSYGFLGTVDESHGVVETDMMYATVQIRESLVSGAQEMLFSVPAALIPTVTYEITLDTENQLEELHVTGAQHPIRLVYEVSLDEQINAVSIHDFIENGSVTPNADGSVDFYTNAYETDHTVGYGKKNTNTYFTPSHQNERYYYAEDCVIYTNTNGTLYEGEQPDAQASLYRGFRVYAWENGPVTKTVYERISPQSLQKAEQHTDGYWYIPADTVHTMLDMFVVNKEENKTATLPFVYNPFVDTKYNYYVGATLGNNGRLTVIPETGLLLTKSAPEAGKEEAFTFTLTRTDKAETTSYKAWLFDADGNRAEQRVLFEDGVATVTLGASESLYIFGMAAGAAYTVTEQPHADYKLVSVNGETALTQAKVTLQDRTLARADFENEKKGYGGVTIVKRITHDFGTSYEIPDKQFTILVELSEEYASKTLQAEHSADPTLTTVTTDENASFTVTLGHGDQLELLRLKEGTVVKVTELDVPQGFVPTYYGAGEQGASAVTIREDASISVIVSNAYTYDEADEVNITVSGTKTLLGRENGTWLDTDVFTFELQRYENGDWVTVATATATKDNPQFDFTAAMQAERFTKSGVYSYQVVECDGDLPGVLYDHTVHTFSVKVGDVGMCGHLHILDVVSHHNHTDAEGNEENGWHIVTDFTNIYQTEGYAEAVIDIRKLLENPSQSDRVSPADFRFGLFESGATTPSFVSDYTDMVGEARLIATFDKAGTYIYTLKELVPEASITGMTYSEEEYTVTVVVSDNAQGALVADFTVTEDGREVSPVFTNTYSPKEATLTPTVYKELIGRELRDGEFEFELRQGDSVLTVGTNDADGNVLFDKPLSFAAVGDYYCDVVERVGEVSGIVYDTMIYRLHITVSDSGDGVLTAHYHVINTAADTVTFRNRYVTEPVRVTVEGFKQLVGRDIINEEFNFVLVEAGNPRGLILSASNYTDGSFRFAPIAYSDVGEYRYSVHEVHESIAHGIVFDDAVYEVTVTVTDDGYGALQATTAIYKDSEAVEQIVFVNEYTTTPAQVALHGTKQLDGRALKEGEFAFELYKADDAWSVDEPLTTVYNDEYGAFSFEALVFEEAGAYRFVVKEQHSGETIDGVTYDDEVYRVLVVVTDNHRGTLFAQTSVLGSSGAYVDALLFSNSYTPTTVTTPTTAPSITTATTTVTTVTTTEVTDTETTATTTVATAVTTTSTAPAPSTPPTGEVSDAALWLALLLVSGCMCTTLAVYGKKRT